MGVGRRKRRAEMNQETWVMLFIVGILACSMSATAGTIVRWDFEEAVDGQYGLETIEESKDVVSGLISTPASGDPVYVRGADGKGHGTGSGILKVAGDDSLLTGFAEFNISFDVRLHAIPTATQALLRYGVSKTAWNIYTTTDSSLRMEMFDSKGMRYTVKTEGAVIPAGDGKYHHCEFVWNGTILSIRVDGESLVASPMEFKALQSTDGKGFLGIGGIVREVGTTGQEFNGFIDNVVICDTAVFQ